MSQLSLPMLSSQPASMLRNLSWDKASEKQLLEFKQELLAACQSFIPFRSAANLQCDFSICSENSYSIELAESSESLQGGKGGVDQSGGHYVAYDVRVRNDGCILQVCEREKKELAEFK